MGKVDILNCSYLNFGNETACELISVKGLCGGY
jgi:hypothetical protein